MAIDQRADLLPLTQGFWRLEDRPARRMNDLEKGECKTSPCYLDLTLDEMILRETFWETIEARATRALHRSYPRGITCLGTPHLLCFGPTPIDAAQSLARGG